MSDIYKQPTGYAKLELELRLAKDQLAETKTQRDEACQHIQWLLPELYDDEQSIIDADARAFLSRLPVMRPSGIPCVGCGGLVIEFSVPNETWNKVVRRSGKETDREYLCMSCYLKAVDEYVANAAIDDPRLTLTAEDLEAALQWRTLMDPEQHSGYYYPLTAKLFESIISALKPADGKKENPNE